MPQAEEELDSKAHEKREAKEIARQARALKRGTGTVYLVLILASALLMLLSPYFNRFLGAWQGVVVAPPEDGEVTVILPSSLVEKRPVSEALARKLSVGDYLDKRSGTWDPVVVEAAQLPERDDVEDPEMQPARYLPKLFERYMKSWRGTIVAVDRRPAKSTGDIGSKRVIHTMKIHFDQGGIEEVEVPEELIPYAKVGTRLEKPERSYRIRVIGQAADLERPQPAVPVGPPSG
ncbi:MAG: hypothetical protein D6729_04775, partial [Deltaproteobacteria bacterium]